MERSPWPAAQRTHRGEKETNLAERNVRIRAKRTLNKGPLWAALNGRPVWPKAAVCF